MTAQHFIVIAWPQDHQEELADHCCDIQDGMDSLMMGGAKVIAPIPPELHKACEGQLKEILRD